FGEPAGLLAGRGFDVGRGVADLHGPAFLRHVVEVCEQPVELLLRHRVEFVVVTPGTAECQPEPDRGRGFHPVYDVLDGVFFGDAPTFGVAAVVSVEPGRDALVETRVRQ